MAYYELIDLYLDKKLNNDEKLSMFYSNYDYFVGHSQSFMFAIIMAGIVIKIIRPFYGED